MISGNVPDLIAMTGVPQARASMLTSELVSGAKLGSRRQLQCGEYRHIYFRNEFVKVTAVHVNEVDAAAAQSFLDSALVLEVAIRVVTVGERLRSRNSSKEGAAHARIRGSNNHGLMTCGNECLIDQRQNLFGATNGVVANRGQGERDA